MRITYFATAAIFTVIDERKANALRLEKDTLDLAQSDYDLTDGLQWNELY